MKLHRMFIVVLYAFFSLFMTHINSCPTSFALELLSTGQISNNDIDSHDLCFKSAGT